MRGLYWRRTILMLFLDSPLCTIRIIYPILAAERTHVQWGEGREKASIKSHIRH